MPVPNHRENCQTIMYYTRCPFCRKKVYYFACSCGSKVFFELNKPPWYPHEKRCWRYLIRIMIEDGYPENYIIDLIEKYASDKGEIIPKDVKQEINKMRGFPI
jgi:hypothetical protein